MAKRDPRLFDRSPIQRRSRNVARISNPQAAGRARLCEVGDGSAGRLSWNFAGTAILHVNPKSVMPDIPTIAISLLILCSISHVGIIVHELGHTTGALLVGWKPYLTTVGTQENRRRDPRG